jgi:hypothetical protein
MHKLMDIFDFDSENENKSNKKIDSQIERMKQLNETFQKRGEFIKESSVKKIDEKKLQLEAEKLKKLSRHRLLNEFGNDGIPFLGMKQAGQGETVNTFLPTIPDSARGTAHSYITSEEALEISIKRAVKSGTPINNMGFYDEVNWNLNNLGFDSKLPVDIKNCMIKIIDKTIHTRLD